MLLGACASTGPRPAGQQPLELTLALADGRTIGLSAYAGQPLLLFVFATYDEGSQLALATLTQYLENHPNTQVAGLMLQPEAETFLPMFKQAITVPFEVYYDPSSQLLQGKSQLGRLEGVPAFVALDAQQHIRRVYYGVPSAADLDALTAL
jgi:peroxiredoxin